MNFLLDMGIPARLTEWFVNLGHQARHVRNVNKLASDSDIIRMALAFDEVILTADKDFGQVIAESNLAKPSVILFRLTPAPMEVVVRRLQPILETYETVLRQGCLITIALGKPRVKLLPIRR